MRYYGRGATGNRILAEREVADLYAHRQSREIDRALHLTTLVAAAPLHGGASWAYMHAFARPVMFDERFLRAQLERADTNQELRDALVAATNVVSDLASYTPDLRQLRGWSMHGAEGIVIESRMNDSRHAIRMTIGHDGEATFIACAGGLAEHGSTVVFGDLIAGNLASFLAAAGAFYARAGYVGSVDVGVALDSIRGAILDLVHQRGVDEPRYPADDFSSTERVVASELAERPRAIALELLQRFFDGAVAVGYEPRI